MVLVQRHIGKDFAKYSAGAGKNKLFHFGFFGRFQKIKGPIDIHFDQLIDGINRTRKMRQVNNRIRSVHQLGQRFFIFQSADDVVDILERFQMLKNAVFADQGFDIMFAAIVLAMNNLGFFSNRVLVDLACDAAELKYGTILPISLASFVTP